MEKKMLNDTLAVSLNAENQVSSTQPVNASKNLLAKINVKALVGSGEKIGALALPFILIGLVLNVLFPAWFSVGGPSMALKGISMVLLVPGVIIWLWSVVLILTRVPRQQLITSGPFSLVKHPLYTGVSLLVLPWVGFLLNTWVGALIGLVTYVGSRIYSPAEEQSLAKTFGPRWDAYCQRVKFPWL